MRFSLGCKIPGGAVVDFPALALRMRALLTALFVLLSLTGCYEVKQEVIPASLGEVIPYSCDQVDFDSGGKILFSPPLGNHDYRFREISYSGSERPGSFRALRIKDNIYAVQAHYNDESPYQILFYLITAERFQVVDITKDTDLKTFASLFGVEYRGDELSKGFTGDPRKILAMLRGMSAVEFEP